MLAQGAQILLKFSYPLTVSVMHRLGYQTEGRRLASVQTLPSANFFGLVCSIFTSLPIRSLFPSFSLPDVLCDPTNLIWRKGTHLR